jgi:hypothetical protein
MSNQPSIEELRAAFGLNRKGRLTRAALLEMKQRRDQLENQIARDAFSVLYDEDFARQIFSKYCTKEGSFGADYGEVVRAASTAADIGSQAAAKIVREEQEEADRESLVRLALEIEEELDWAEDDDDE